ncbi:MAG: carbamoyltransferase HypF [Deltaproteobacteria bacterium]|nr:carbamoyltransferase HypF [Deltaproteobacteria bacterium]
MTDQRVARRLEVNGIVQGVGFRPFVFQLAEHYGLKGKVANTSSGVTIHIEGAPGRVAAFESDLAVKNPPLAHIVEIAAEDRPVKNYLDFRIVESRGEKVMTTLISPDVSVCDDCLAEMFDPRNRRYRYPFINCTNCGPRYTIIDDIPYDRPKTSMRHFKMCPQCQAEYDDPTNRRFHAQPNACSECGPQVSLFDNRRRQLITDDPIARASELLKQGRILAIKGLGGYHLAVDATDGEAVMRLRSRKLREEKPLALMAYDLESVRRFAWIDPAEEELLASIRRPIVLLKKKAGTAISDPVAPRNNYFGVMLPYTPLHYLLLQSGFEALVMTSGNLSEEPIAIDNDDAFQRLEAIADYFLVHNRDIYLRSDDSIMRYVAGSPRFIRRSRGFVPIPIFLKAHLPPVLACGAELKNTVCLTRRDTAFLSQHIGDLENLATLEFFQLTIDHLQRILDIHPEIIACDMHPDYLSTRYADEQTQIPKIRVQHHHAHIVSCMAENRLDGPVIGLAFDGTGYGSDGTIWGGEILIAEARDFKRVGHLAAVPMPGGAAAIKEPWRMMISYLADAFGADFDNRLLDALQSIEAAKIDVVRQMISRRINAPLTSSLGRLFDAVAAICGIRNRVSFEGQAAMELEMAASGDGDRPYEHEWKTEGIYRILPAPIIRGVVADMQQGVPVGRISARFHRTLVYMFAELCDVVGKEHGLKQVVLSGGCFQNALLLEGLVKMLRARKFEVFTHCQVPANDGGIALGQAVAAAAGLRS